MLERPTDTDVQCKCGEKNKTHEVELMNKKWVVVCAYCGAHSVYADTARNAQRAWNNGQVLHNDDCDNLRKQADMIRALEAEYKSQCRAAHMFSQENTALRTRLAGTTDVAGLKARNQQLEERQATLSTELEREKNRVTDAQVFIKYWKDKFVEKQKALQDAYATIDDMFKSTKASEAAQPMPCVNTVAEETVCQEADRIVGGPKREEYGDPRESLERVAKMWTIIVDSFVGPQDVALMMICMKIAREYHAHKRDNIVDMIGYAKLLQSYEESV